MKMKWIARLGAGLVIGTLLVGEGVTVAADPVAVVARFGDEAVSRDEVDALARRMGIDAVTDEAHRQRALATVLEQIIDQRAVRAELLRLGLGVEPAAVETAIDRLRKQMTAQGKDFTAFLAESGKSLESFREQVALELTIQAYVRPRTTQDALDRVFEQHQRELDGTRLRVSHVILRPDGGGSLEATARLMKQAEALRQDLVQGRLAFAEAATMWSAGPSRRSGGDLGWITREGPMIEPFTATVYKLPKGGISEPFLTPYGIHIATVTGVEPGRVGPTAVRSKLERLLAAELVRGLVVEGRRRVGVTILPGVPHFDPSTLGEPNDKRPVVVTEPKDL